VLTALCDHWCIVAKLKELRISTKFCFDIETAVPEIYELPSENLLLLCHEENTKHKPLKGTDISKVAKLRLRT